jgi:hypothetical protein
MMDKRFFDPRRPLGPPTVEDKAEMLIPYAAELPLAPQLFATHDRLVANLRGAFLVFSATLDLLQIRCPANLTSSQEMLHLQRILMLSTAVSPWAYP